MPKIDVARLNALRPKPKHSENPPEAVRTPSEDETNSMEFDRVLTIPLDKPFEEAYFTHRLWMFFRETRETEEDIRRMFCEAREKMRKRNTLKKKSDPGQFAIPCTVETSKELFTFVDCSLRNSEEIVRDLEVQIGNALVPVDFHVLDIKLNWNSSLLLGRAFLSTVGVVCNLQTNQLCLTLIDLHVHYNPIPVKKPHTTSGRINDPRIIAACHCGAEYETEYLASIETHTATSVDSAQPKSTDAAGEESVDNNQREWENDYYNPTMAAHTEEYDEDYEEEQAIEQRVILDKEDRLFHHSSWKKKSPSIDMNGSTSIDTQLHQPNRLRASTDIAHYPSIDTNVDATRDGNYSIGSWADERHHESYAVEIAYRDHRTDELYEDFTYEELLNMQRRDEADKKRAEAAWERTHFSHPIDRAIPPSIDINPSTSIDINHTPSIDIHPKPKTTVSEKDKFDNLYLTLDEFGIFRDPNGYARAIDGCTLHVSLEDIPDILQTANEADNLFMKQHNLPEQQQKEEKDEYGIYGDDQGYARDVDGHTIRVHNKDIRRLLESASRDDPNYICLPEHASSFTQTKLVPETYTKDEINEMFSGVCGEQEKNKEHFQMKLDGVYYPLNDSIGWLTTCMEEMRQDIARIQRATDVSHPTSIDRRRQASIDNRLPASVDDNLPHAHTMKSQPDFHTREEIDQLVEGIYRALETTEERLDRRCDDIYFPIDLTISALTSKIEAIQGD
ncbi:hypothetical protein F2Q70_00004217 [Brassica cretica]|uniref:Uncharacterized protein n=1 Tax=Brassica cretica TaxID=69181 RepID=A0A8S9IM74_BRACR|nr:hypothetical protein F2Q70_00004217 [Brassica cretica]